MIRSPNFVLVPAVVVSFGALAACEKKEAAPPTPAADSTATKHDDHDHAAGDGHDHSGHDDHDHAGHGDHGPVTELGEKPIAAFKVKASRDGDITPGGDAPVDVWITPDAPSGAKVAAVRFWIGTQDAKGSIKAKAEIESDNWHTHVEVPDPLPSGSMLWVEIEDASGAVSAGSFDLKAAK